MKALGVQGTNEEFIKLQNTLNGLQAEVGLREIRKRTEEISKVWERFQLQINKLDFNKTKTSIDTLKSKIDTIGNTIQDLKSKGLTDKDLGIQILSVQFEGLDKKFKKLQTQLQLFQEFQSVIEQGLTGAVNNLVDAFANGEDIFEALQNSVKQLIVELTKAIIRSLLLKAITTAIAGPAAGKAAGAVGGSFIRSDFIFSGLARGSQSDKRLKKNIKFIGVSESGINIYEFEYLHKDGKYIGVIAQELLNTKFESALMYINDFYEVNYSLIDVQFKKIS